LIRWIVILVGLSLISCSPKLPSNNPIGDAQASEAFLKVADKGILIGTFAHDSLSVDPASTLPISTIFELGDFRQIFTAIGIHNLADDGKIDLSHSINRYLPIDFQMTTLNNITIQDCLSHLGGFPKIPNNIGSLQSSPNQPYENYRRNHLRDFLQSWQPTGEKSYQYSFIGYALLGIAFEDELTFEFTINKADIIQGHNRIGNEVPPLEAGIFEPAAGGAMPFHILHSLVMAWNDEAYDHFSGIMKPIAPTDPKSQTSIASAWHIYKVNKSYDVILQKGSTSGHSIFMAICPQTKSGVVIAAPKKVNLGPLGMFVLGQLNNDWKKN